METETWIKRKMLPKISGLEIYNCYLRKNYSGSQLLQSEVFVIVKKLQYMGLLSKSEGKSIVFYGSNRIKNKNKRNSTPSYPAWKFLKLRSATTNSVTDVVNYKHELVTDHCKKTRQVSYLNHIFFCFHYCYSPFSFTANQYKA